MLEFPLAGRYLLKSEKNAPKKVTGEVVDKSKSAGTDRGFYVFGDEFVDDYIVGSTVDIPGGELENVDDDLFVRYGDEDAVEEIEFQLPGQIAHHPKAEYFDSGLDDLLDNYGTVDPTIPTSKIRCTACGANFHCRDASLPGFLPAEVFLNLDDYAEQLCRRCYMLKRHNFLVSFCINHDIFNADDIFR
ncbi:unnamed protein product [Gongylonema pulchrum]|uniref:HNH endonuclease n=1 Tax=Gongylonema pulchrum TaxID=637853 RepID=A0A183DWH9_9BILA|nr:unnamed protein product [Gongylonema pulchrum]